GVDVHAHAVQSGDGVGRGVFHPGGGVEQEDAVADPRGLLAGDLFDRERELARRDHAGEAVEDLDVDALQLPRPATGRGRRRASEHTDQALAPTTHGDALHPGPLAPVDADLAVDDLAQLPRPGHDGPLALVHDATHLVLAVEGLARR